MPNVPFIETDCDWLVIVTYTVPVDCPERVSEGVPFRELEEEIIADTFVVLEMRGFMYANDAPLPGLFVKA
jgi:hypothetical protein